MKAIALKIDSTIEPLRQIANTYVVHLLDLLIRLYMANVFFVSGWGKFENLLNGNWGRTVFLFEEIHPLPFLSAEIAAIMGTGGELLFPALLALGLFTRFGAAGLLFMTFTIQFLVPAEYEIANPDHYFWMLLLAVPLIYGPGKVSADYFLQKFLKKSDPS